MSGSEDKIRSEILKAAPGLTSEAVDQFIKSEIRSPEETKQFYDKWAPTYENYVLKEIDKAYDNHQVVAAIVNDLFKENKAARILDIAAGTGLLTIELSKHGLTNVDALDGSSGMLDRAKERNLYKIYSCQYVTENPLTDIEDGTYDAAITTGSFCPGHLSAKCLRTIGRTIKSGGYFVMAMRSEFITHPYLVGLEDTMTLLEKENFWKLIKRDTFENYYNANQGTTFVFQKH